MHHTDTTSPGLLPALGLITLTGLVFAVAVIGGLYSLSLSCNWLLGHG